MATAEVTQDKLDKAREDNEKLREQIAAEEAKAAEVVASQSRSVDYEAIENENERLKARLEQLKAATKAQKEAASPIEQAEAAAEADANVNVPTDDEKKGN